MSPSTEAVEGGVLTICALRFDVSKYQLDKGLLDQDGTYSGLGPLVTSVLDTFQLHSDPLDNFAVFFVLQRYLYKWGGDMLPLSSREHLVFRFLFLDLYRRQVPPRYRFEEYCRQWEQEFVPRLEYYAAIIRTTFRRASSSGSPLVPAPIESYSTGSREHSREYSDERKSTMDKKNGAETGRFGVWLAQRLGSMPKYQDYLVLYDHADTEKGAHPTVIHGFYGNTPTNVNRLAEVDVMVATPSKEVVLVIEIEESQSPPKKLLGDILAILMCNHFAARVAGEQKVFSVTDQTQLIIASVAAEHGSGQRKINDVIIPRMRQMVSSPDGIRTGNVRLLLRPDAGTTITALEEMVGQLFQ